ncbi:MAG: ABC transporter substrate-binding protein [Actinomycetota bacterium]|nr:ABC transporter substrate-binding protein [Actinomycetota bacterium]
MKIKNRWLQLLALLLAFSMVAAACGGGSSDAPGDGDAGADAEADAEEQAIEDAVTDARDGDEEEPEEEMAAPTNMEELEARWEANRQKIVDKLTEGIESGEYGLDEATNIVTGPSGIEIDLNNCPSNWTNDEGIADTIEIGYSGPESGNLAAYGNMAVGWNTYIDYVNENGGIGGTPIELLTRDDQYVATVAIEQVDQLLQADKPFAIHTLGTPSVMATRGTLNEKCVPNPFVNTGHPAWGDPLGHPWTTGSFLNYLTEAILWGAWIKENMADQLPVEVVGIVMENDFGIAYQQGMEDYAKKNPDVVSKFTAIPFDPAAPTLTNEMTTAAALKADVAIGMMAGNPCLQMIEEAGRNGMQSSGMVLFISQTCKDPNSFMIPAGSSSDGWYIVGGGQKVNTDPQYADDVYVQFANQLITDAGHDPKIGLIFTGMFFIWGTVEALRIAEALPDGLTRTNFMLALRSLDLEHPQLVKGVKFRVDGTNDAYLVEGSDFSQWDSEGETWKQLGGLVDIDGLSGTCTWKTDGSGCG